MRVRPGAGAGQAVRVEGRWSLSSQWQWFLLPRLRRALYGCAWCGRLHAELCSTLREDHAYARSPALLPSCNRLAALVPLLRVQGRAPG